MGSIIKLYAAEMKETDNCWSYTGWQIQNLTNLNYRKTRFDASEDYDGDNDDFSDDDDNGGVVVMMMMMTMIFVVVMVNLILMIVAIVMGMF